MCYEIGERIITDKKDIVITNKKTLRKSNGDAYTAYQYRCNICGFDCEHFYYGGEYVEKRWLTYSQIRTNKSCSCCAGKAVKPEINSIEKTYSYLIPYFVDKSNARKYSYMSNKKVDFKCPYCGEIKNMCIADLSINGFSCPCCSDGLSIGERELFILYCKIIKLIL